MLIDWFTVGAQALNFLVLVWLLKRFLYQPILRAIDAREARIAAELADADAKKAEANSEREEFRTKNAELDRKRADLLREATDAAHAERQRLFDEARQAANQWSARRQEMLENDAIRLNEAITLRAQQEVFAIARKVLADLAGASLEERIIEVFTRRLDALDEAARQRLADAIKASSDPVLLRSTFELSIRQRATIQQALNGRFADAVRIRFETAPSLVSGIELIASGQKLAWSIADYLASLSQAIDELVDKRATAEPSHDGSAGTGPDAQP